MDTDVAAAMRILDSRESFAPVSSESLFESDYEKCILRNAPHLFPDAIVLPFKAKVESDEGTAVPDMVMLDRRFRGAWIVEAELSHHSLAQHVEPQVRRLVFGRYGRTHVNYILAQAPLLPPLAVERLFCGPYQPPVLLLVDRLVVEWKAAMSPLGVHIGVVELFRSASNRELLRLNGELPALPGDLVAECVRHQLHPGWLVLRNADMSIFQPGLSLSIAFGGRTTRWTCRPLGMDLVLFPEERCPLPGQYKRVAIFFDERNGLSADVS